MSAEVDTSQVSTRSTIPLSTSRPQPLQDGQVNGSQPLAQQFPLVRSNTTPGVQGQLYGQVNGSQPLAQQFPLVRSNTTPGMQGQLYELAEQIQMLQVQSREIEQRLQGISTVLDRLDRFDYPEPSPAEAFTTTTFGNAPRPN